MPYLWDDVLCILLILFTHKTQVIWDVTLCYWVSGAVCLETMVPSSSRVRWFKKISFLLVNFYFESKGHHSPSKHQKPFTQ